MRLIVSIILLFTSLLSHSQFSYNFTHIYLDKGLSNSRIDAITQDKFGYLWFGSFDGLNRYDGYAIKTFFSSNKSNQLPSNRIEALYSDSKGRLWIGTNKGFVQFDFYKEEFIYPDTLSEAGAIIKQAYVSCFKEDSSHNLYMASNSGVFVLKSNAEKWEKFGELKGTERKLTNVDDLLFYPANTMWATTDHKGFFKIDLPTKHAELIDYVTEFGDSCCYTMNEMKMINDHEIMVGMFSYGLAIFNITTNKFITVPGFLGKSDSIRFNAVYAVLRDKQNNIWLGTSSYGLVNYLRDEKGVKQIMEDPLNPFSYTGQTITCLYQDRQQNIWIGSLKNGVYRFNPNKQSVSYHSLNSALNTLSNNAVCFAQQDSSSVWVGTGKGPVLYDLSKNSLLDLRITSSIFKSLPQQRINSIVKDSTGNIWFATSGSGLIRFDRVHNKYTHFLSDAFVPNHILGNNITRLLYMPNDEILILSGRRLSRMNAKTFYVNNWKYDSSHVLSQLTNVSDMYVDDNNKVWISTYRSKLYEYDPFSQKIVDHITLSNNLLTGGIIYTIASNKSKIICGTIDGLLTYDKNTKEIRQYLQQPQNRNITSLLPAKNEVWFSNERTLGKLDLQSGAYIEVKNEMHESFLPLPEKSLYRLTDGSLLCATAKGFIQIDPKTYSQSPNVFKPFITSFKVGNKELQSGIALKQIDLSYNENFFSFDISAFNYLDADNIEYAYMLEGFDKQWQALNKQRSGTYTNVPGGNYTLKLRAISTSGTIVENEQSIHIHVDKPFWETWWFRIAILFLAAAIIYTFYRYRVQLINKEAQIKTDYEIKMNELENSALRTQMNPHFIFNSLNTINSFINSNDKTQANQYISKFSKLMRLILDHSREKKILLSDEIEVLQLYIQIERIRFENKFDYDIEVDENIDATTIEISPLIIQPFVENAILHGLLPLSTTGLLKVKMERSGDILLCTVEDNGVGRGAKRSQTSDPNKRKSHGITITIKRIEMFNKEHNLNAEVEVIDLVNNDGSPAGTKVIIPVAWSESF